VRLTQKVSLSYLREQLSGQGFVEPD
jgi:hypothetical protein